MAPTRSSGRSAHAGSDYVPSLDGQRFLLTMPAVASAPPAIVVTLNWPELLRRDQ